MSEQQQNPKPADADFGWAEAKASEGETFRVKASDYDISKPPEGEDNAVAASGPSFKNMSVNWTVGSEGSPSVDQQNESAITWYKLSKTPWWNVVCSYELTINARNMYDYYFTDGTGDRYNLNLFQNGGTHYIQFNSSNPTIVKVEGS